MSNCSTAMNGSDRPARYALQGMRSRVITSALALMLSDVLVFMLAKLLFRDGHTVPQILFLADPSSGHAPTDVFSIFCFLFVVIRYLAGDYTRRRLFWDRAKGTTLTILVVAIPFLLLLVGVPGQYSEVAEFGSWGFCLFVIPMARHGVRHLMNVIGIWRIPTALIASDSRASDVFMTINTTLSMGADIRWLAIDNPADAPVSNPQGVKRIEHKDSRELAARLAAEGCDQAVIATEDMQSSSFAELIQRLMEESISVSFIPSFRRLPLVGVTTSYFFGRDILLFQVRSSLQSAPSRFAKRLFDIVASLAALILLSPLFLAVAVAIKRHDGGRIIYRQKRTGRHGEPFFCLKFRTMAPDADERLACWRVENPALYEEFQRTFKLTNDPRITHPGAWLRKTSLDELPQLVNVLRGEMSLVGPRPVLEKELIEFYGPAAQLYRRVRPGLTGLWQIRGRSDTSYEERVVFDEWYILNWSFWYDLVILLQTVWVVVMRKGAY